MSKRNGLFQRKPGGVWYAVVEWKGRRYCESTRTPNKTDAKTYRNDEMLAKLRRGTYQTPDQRKHPDCGTVSGLADRWLSVYVKVRSNPKGQALRAQRVKDYMKPALGHLSLDRVTENTLLEFRAYLEALRTKTKDDKGKEIEVPSLSTLTVGHILADARCCFLWAKLPVPRRLVPKAPELEPRYLSDAEQATLRTMEEPYGLANRIMLDSGARWSEMARLTASDVVGTELVIQGATKTKRMRRVPIPAALLQELRGHVGKLVPFEPGDNPVFCRSVQRKTGIEDYSAHRCRHTFAINYIRKGGNLRFLQIQLGHGSLSTTEIYLRADQELIREDAKRVHAHA